jgi:hypothetical protein
MPKHIKGQLGFTPEEALEWLKARTREDEKELRILLRKKQSQPEIHA